MLNEHLLKAITAEITEIAANIYWPGGGNEGGESRSGKLVVV